MISCFVVSNNDVLVSWESFEPYCTDLWRHILRGKGCVFQVSIGAAGRLAVSEQCALMAWWTTPGVTLEFRNSDVFVAGLAGLALVQLSVSVPRPCSSMFYFQFPALEGPKSQDLYEGLNRAANVFSHHLMPDDPWIWPLVLMSQKVIALIHHASSGHWIPISVDQVVLHAGPSTETNLEPSRWLWENDPHGPQSNRHGMSWFMLFHAGVFTYFYKHCFLLIHA